MKICQNCGQLNNDWSCSCRDCCKPLPMEPNLTIHKEEIKNKELKTPNEINNPSYYINAQSSKSSYIYEQKIPNFKNVEYRSILLKANFLISIGLICALLGWFHFELILESCSLILVFLTYSILCLLPSDFKTFKIELIAVLTTAIAVLGVFVYFFFK